MADRRQRACGRALAWSRQADRDGRPRHCRSTARYGLDPAKTRCWALRSRNAQSVSTALISNCRTPSNGNWAWPFIPASMSSLVDASATLSPCSTRASRPARPVIAMCRPPVSSPSLARRPWPPSKSAGACSPARTPMDSSPAKVPLPWRSAHRSRAKGHNLSGPGLRHGAEGLPHRRPVGRVHRGGRLPTMPSVDPSPRAAREIEPHKLRTRLS